MLRSTPKDRSLSAVARGAVAAGAGGTCDRRSNDETVVACPEDWWLGCQAAARAKPIGSRPNRPNRSHSVTADDIEQPVRDMDSEIGVNAD
jgi:hypothetical protein